MPPPSFQLALTAAQQVAGGQDYPQATLYVVATPIGNLADISLRALQVLHMADTLACEDTRHTGAMLAQLGLNPQQRLVAAHQHNEAEAAQLLIQRLSQGQRVAYVSDAGTPAISDPGARLVAAVQVAGFRVMPLPGASSVTTLLSAAGTGPVDGAWAHQGFAFVGFLPTRRQEREQALAHLQRTPQAVVLLEAPHRMEALASDLSALGSRRITVGRELTKQFEEIATLACSDLTQWLAQSPQRLKGEFALALHPLPAKSAAESEEGDADTDRCLHILLTHLPLKQAVQIATELCQQPKNSLYARALALKAQLDGA